jgi:hypothetical protein
MKKLLRNVDVVQIAQVAVITLAVAYVATLGPAYAFDAAAGKISDAACDAFNAAKTVLITAAVLALIVGLAPMLWGQVKVKWIISCLVACVLFGQVGAIVAAFASGGRGC